MKVLGISGTPRPGGNSELLLEYAVEPFLKNGWEATILKLSALNIRSCQACDTCTKTGKCIIKDDMSKFYEAFSTCQALIVATPVYYRNISSGLAAVFERHYGCRQLRPLKGKPGGAIAVGRGASDGGQSFTISIIHNWLLSCGAICVPGELNGLTASADKPGDILQQENRLNQAVVLGENVMKTAEKLFGRFGK